MVPINNVCCGLTEDGVGVSRIVCRVRSGICNSYGWTAVPLGFLVAITPHRFLLLPWRRPSRRGDTISLFNAAIEAVNLAKEASSITPAKAAFASAGILLRMIKVCFILCDEMFQVYTQPGIYG